MARIDSCERGNIVRKSQRKSNAILIRLLDSTAQGQTATLQAARQRLIDHSDRNPNDPVAQFAVEVAKSGDINLRALREAQETLREQTRELAPVDCSKTTQIGPE